MSLDMAKLLAQKEKLTRELSRTKIQTVLFWKPKVGANTIRLLPCWTQEGPFAGGFGREVYQHWNVSDTQKAPVVCPKQTPHMSGECPICDFVDELRARKSDPKAQLNAKKVMAKSSFFINLLDQKDPVFTAQDVATAKEARPDQEVPFNVGDPKVQVYACAKTVYDSIITCILENRKDITSLSTGHDIVITRVGTDTNTRYTVSAKLQATPVKNAEAIKLPELDKVGFVMEYDDMCSLLASGTGKDYMASLPSSTGSSVVDDDDLPPSYGGSSNDDTTTADDLEREMQAQLG